MEGAPGSLGPLTQRLGTCHRSTRWDVGLPSLTLTFSLLSRLSPAFPPAGLEDCVHAFCFQGRKAPPSGGPHRTAARITHTGEKAFLAWGQTHQQPPKAKHARLLQRQVYVWPIPGSTLLGDHRSSERRPQAPNR